MNEQTQSVSQKTVREQLAQTITYHIAATIISDNQFPKKGILPTLSPVPLRNLGHYVSLDYHLLIKIIWQIIDEIKTAGAKIYKSIPSKSWITIGIVAAILLALLTQSQALFMYAMIPGAIIGFVSVNNARYKLLRKEIAGIRARAIKKLVAGDWTPALSGELGAKIERELKSKEIGNGVLGINQIPVIVITDDKHPFPGYGRLQTESQFVCRPKKPSSVNDSQDGRFKTIQDSIMNAVTNFPTGEMSCGEVLVLHGNSLPMDSAWLNENKAPRLWLDRKDLDKISVIDERASVRQYFAVQLILKDYGTVATFFIRPFMAGNSLCSHVAFTTIGPHNRGADYFQKRLLKYEDEEKNGFDNKPKVKKDNSKNKVVSESTRLVQSIREIAESGAEFQSTEISYSEIKKLDPLDLEQDEDYQKEFKELVGKSSVWLGWLLEPLNWREGYSMTFTNDYFGKTEGRASVTTLYDQICRSMLDTIDSLGYDISEYRDSEGNYSIHAERIEQLVVGERIHIEGKKDEKEPDKSKEKKITEKKAEISQPQAGA